MTETARNDSVRTQSPARINQHAAALVSVLRLCIGFVTTVLTLLALLLGRLPAGRFGALLVVTLLLVFANALVVWHLRRGGSFFANATYLLSLLDVAFVLTVVTLYFGAAGHATARLLLLGGLTAALGLSSLYHDPRVVSAGGIAAVIAGGVYFVWGAGGAARTASDYAHELAVLMLLLGLSIVVTRSMARYFAQALNEARPNGWEAVAGLTQRMPYLLFCVDGAMRIRWAAGACRAICGRDAEQLRGIGLGELMALPESFVPVSRRIAQICARKGGNEPQGYIAAELWPAPPVNGAETWEGVLRDVTEQERLLREREVMVERLHRYQKMDSLGTLASGMAHDFNHIVQRVTDALGTLLQQAGEPQTRQQINMIIEQLHDAHSLVAQLLTLGSGDTLSLERIDMREFIPWLGGVAGQHLDAGYRLVCTAGEQEMPVRADRDYLRRALENIIRNACDAMPEGGVIDVSGEVERGADGAGEVVLRIRDTGTGIPQEIRDRIFDPFVSSKGRHKGSGLGLALTQHIIALHTATIVVEKSDAHGTTFRITLPLAESLEVNSDTRWMASGRIRTRVLVLDDDEKIREVMKSFLTDLHYEVSEAGDCAGACAELTRVRDTCRVALMDWKLGDGVAAEVIGTLRRIRDDLIIIVVSGYAPDRGSIEAYGIRRWFTKPYDRALLDLEIQRALYLTGR